MYRARSDKKQRGNCAVVRHGRELIHHEPETHEEYQSITTTESSLTILEVWVPAQYGKTALTQPGFFFLSFVFNSTFSLGTLTILRTSSTIKRKGNEQKYQKKNHTTKD